MAVISRGVEIIYFWLEKDIHNNSHWKENTEHEFSLFYLLPGSMGK